MITSVDDHSTTSLSGTIEYSRMHHRLPQRALPKNKTGVFIEGQRGHSTYSNYWKIPPLARPRGTPVPDYSPSYARQSAQEQVVEKIRARQEWKGGFFPQPVKKNKSKQLHGNIGHRPSPHLLNGLPAYRDLTKHSARNYVAASNSGITHLEDLRSESLSSASLRGDCAYDTDDMDMKSIAMLEDVYKRIEKEEDTRCGKGRLKSGKKQSPLLIRSFRNPQNPHPVVQYTDLRETNNAGREHYVSRPPVPAPYFYSNRTLPKASDNGGSRVRLSRLPGARSSEHILAAPGAGFLTKAALTCEVKGHPPPLLVPKGKQAESEEQVSNMEKFRVPSTTPATSIPDLPEALDEGIEENNDHFSSTDCNHNKSIENQKKSSAPVMITLSLETVEGVSRAIDLDEEEERNKRDVIEYHAVERALLGISGGFTEPMVESMQGAESKDPPREPVQLLNEQSENSLRESWY